MKIISNSIEETKDIGKKIASKLKGGEIIALHGDLGAGKTVITKGIAQGLGYNKIVNSPTFVLMKIYKIPSTKKDGLKIPLPPEERTGNPTLIKGEIKRICHIDAYRISTEEEIEGIGIYEYLGKRDTICIIEWPERIKKIMPKNTKWINLKCGEKENIRKIDIM